MTNLGNYNGSSAICYKIDAVTIVFENCSFVNVLDAVGLSDFLTPDFVQLFSSRYLSSYGYAADVKMSFDGIGLQSRVHEVLNAFDLKNIDLIDSIDPHEFFEKKLGYIRLDMMGKALDYVRSRGIDIDNWVFKPFLDQLPEGAAYHFTRLDVAYDLLDYKPEFIKLCKAACHLYQSDEHRISCAGINSGTTWSERNGDQDTLYLGKGSGDRMLRIYDKKLQYVQSGKYYSDCPYFFENNITGEKLLPNSWIRIELQCRREKQCHNILYGENASFLGIFKYIYETYAIRQGQGRNVPVCEFWDDLFDWEIIPTIIQKTNYCIYIDPYQRASKYVSEIALGPILQVIAQIGFKAFIIMIEQAFQSMQIAGSGSSDRRRFDRIMGKILIANHNKLPAFVYKNKRSGVYYFEKDYTDLQPNLYKMLEELEKLS